MEIPLRGAVTGFHGHREPRKDLNDNDTTNEERGLSLPSAVTSTWPPVGTFHGPWTPVPRESVPIVHRSLHVSISPSLRLRR